MLRKTYLAALFFLASCSPSAQDYHREGEAFCRELADELHKIESRKDLQLALPVLKKKFNSLAMLILQAREYQKKHPEECIEELEPAYASNLALIEELQRIYQLEGGQELMEKAEHEALLRLLPRNTTR